MFHARIEIKNYGVRFQNPFWNRRAMKIAHQADKSFRRTYDFRNSVQTSRMSPRAVMEELRGEVFEKCVEEFFEKGLRGGLFVLASKRLSKKSPFWGYTN